MSGYRIGIPIIFSYQYPTGAYICRPQIVLIKYKIITSVHKAATGREIYTGLYSEIRLNGIKAGIAKLPCGPIKVVKLQTYIVSTVCKKRTVMRKGNLRKNTIFSGLPYILLRNRDYTGICKEYFVVAIYISVWT